MRREALEAVGLDFRGFGVPMSVRDEFKARFGAEALAICVQPASFPTTAMTGILWRANVSNSASE